MQSAASMLQSSIDTVDEGLEEGEDGGGNQRYSYNKSFFVSVKMGNKFLHLQGGT